LTTLIETIAGVRAASRLGQALNARAEILRLSEAAHDAVLLPREPGSLSHGLRAALAARMCRHVGDEALTAHYESYLAHASDLDLAALARPGGVCGDSLHDAMARHRADVLNQLAELERTQDELLDRLLAEPSR